MTEAGKCAAIILAAGFSSRMQEFKPLLTIGGETIADRVIATFLRNGVEVLLVTGWRGDELIAGIGNRNITVVENPDYKSGMFSSVWAGVDRLPPDCGAFFVMPVDIPLVRQATVKRLLVAAAEYPGRTVFPVFNGKRGHPPLIPASLVPEIKSWERGGGLEAVLASFPRMQLDVSVPDEYILMDIDTRKDYERLLERFRWYDIPSEQECEAILNIIGTADNIRRHCRKVADVAVAIARALTDAGSEVDVEAVRSAAVLHDISKGEAEHDIAGGKILRDFGFAEIGDIIAVHTDLADGDDGASLETKIVYLADKYVRDEEIVSIRERYHSAREKYGEIPGVAEKIERWENDALKVEADIESLLGYSLQRIVFRDVS